MSEREDSLNHIAAQVNKHRRRGVTGCSCGSWFALNGRSVDEQHAEHVAEFVLKSVASIVKAAYEAAAQVAGEMDYSSDDAIGKAIRASIPESTLLGAQIAELEARLKEARKAAEDTQTAGVRMPECPDGPWTMNPSRQAVLLVARNLFVRVADLESQIAAARAEMRNL